MEQANPEEKTREFVDICHEHGLKVTPQRVTIYREIINMDTHPTADAIYQIVKKEYPNISFDTVNRTLQTFADIGLVDVMEVFGGAKRFDPNVDDHHHLHCIRCGHVIDFSNRTYDELDVPEEIQQEFTVLGKRVVLKGICKACAA
ncbi:MAG: Fur family transcriptional regulator [Thermodesulfobacteriota bacterium]